MRQVLASEKVGQQQTETEAESQTQMNQLTLVLEMKQTNLIQPGQKGYKVSHCVGHLLVSSQLDQRRIEWFLNASRGETNSGGRASCSD